MTTSFLDALDGRVLVCDGAMGTMLYARGIFLNRCFDELNVSQPDLVRSVHHEYIRAGADVIESNTFGANRFKLANFGLADQVRPINIRGAQIAREAAGDDVWVAGSMGPLGVRIEPWGRTGVDEAEAAFGEQAHALLEGGAQLFMLETFRDLNELLAAIRAIRQLSSLPIVAQMTTEEDGHSLDGTPPETFTPELERAGADVIGVNCSVGPAAMLETVETMARLTHARLAAQPNAGRPRDVDGRNLYLCSPEYMASYARRFISAGVRLVGGCCGTTPEHIRQIAVAVRTTAPRAVRPQPETAADGRQAPVVAVPRREKSALGRALDDRRFVIVTEVSAPRGLDLAAAAAQARRFRDLGATAVNVPDYPKSGARASALALAVLLEQARIETLLHYSCRNRNLMGMQSDLVGAHAMGLRNVLLTTGNPAPQATYPDATSVFDVDAIGLTNMVVRLNQGRDIADQPLGAPTQFHVGVAVNPFAPHLEAEWRRLDHKVEAGAEFIVTPPILDVAAFDAVLPRLRGTGLPVIAGVAALESVRHAEFLASEVVGVRVADALLERLRRAGDEAAEALAAAFEIARALAERVHGLQISTVHGSPQTGERLLAQIMQRLPQVVPAARGDTGAVTKARHG
ncbi:MAG TPA: bifunctional homocysteine S-methyltransferase/methylenetetrahydrofolate reductase [Vicinamibacterales bacterium]